MIVVLGGSGYVGTAFPRWLETAGLEYLSVLRAKCNYYDPIALDDILSSVKPGFLINAAGFVGRPNVDAFEKHRRTRAFQRQSWLAH
jgi:dTDP-4-dehydrorhamnose reductase